MCDKMLLMLICFVFILVYKPINLLGCLMILNLRIILLGFREALRLFGRLWGSELKFATSKTHSVQWVTSLANHVYSFIIKKMIAVEITETSLYSVEFNRNNVYKNGNKIYNINCIRYISLLWIKYLFLKCEL